MYERVPEHEETRSYTGEPGNLSRLSDMHDWQIAEGEPDIRGWQVVDRNRDTIGEIEDLLVDLNTSEVVFAILSYGEVLGLGGDKTLIPIDKISLDVHNKSAIYYGLIDQIRNAPIFTSRTNDFTPFYNYWGSEENRIRISAQVDIRGWTVVDRSNNPIGMVDDLITDTPKGMENLAVISFEHPEGIIDATLVPFGLLDVVDINRKLVMFHGTWSDMDAAPRYRRHGRNTEIFYDYWRKRLVATPIAEQGRPITVTRRRSLESEVVEDVSARRIYREDADADEAEGEEIEETRTTRRKRI